MCAESQQVVFGHQDFEHDLSDNVRLTFRWAPYAENLTHILQAWTAHSEAPTSVIMSAGLWHMLHVTNAAGYQETLSNLKAAASRFVSVQPASMQPYLSFFSISEVGPQSHANIAHLGSWVSTCSTACLESASASCVQAAAAPYV